MLLDALSQALAHPVRPANLPRMAESASWIASCCPAFGRGYEAWGGPSEAAQAVGSETAVTSSVVATALLRWWNGGPFTSWGGTAAELSEALRPFSSSGPAPPAPRPGSGRR